MEDHSITYPAAYKTHCKAENRPKDLPTERKGYCCCVRDEPLDYDIIEPNFKKYEE